MGIITVGAHHDVCSVDSINDLCNYSNNKNMNLNKEQLKMHWKEIQAWADGKQIQYRIDDECAWEDIDVPAFFPDCEYRVKPEPILIPFDYSDAEQLLGRVVTRKDVNKRSIIVEVREEGGVEGRTFHGYSAFLTTCLFADGSPCVKH